MIEPISSEAEWIPVWSGATRWEVPEQPMLVIAPHPDDETLGAGGVIALQTSRGMDVRVVAVTDGENAYSDGIDIAARRSREQTAALKRLGVNSSQITRLGLTDSGVSCEQDSLVQQLIPLIANDTHILAPWPGDFHPDHQACGRAALEVARRVRASLTFYFFWTWHCGTPELVSDLSLVSVKLPVEVQRARADALGQHQSQLEHDSGQPILPSNLLWPAQREYEIFLPA